MTRKQCSFWPLESVFFQGFLGLFLFLHPNLAISSATFRAFSSCLAKPLLKLFLLLILTLILLTILVSGGCAC